MRAIFISFIIPSLLSTAISQDPPLFYNTPEPYQLDWDATDSSLLGEPLPLEDSIVEENPPGLLSSNECSSGDLGWTGKLRRRQAACRSEISPSTEGTNQGPTELEEKKTTDETNSLLQGLIRDDYQSPPTLEGQGCPSFVAGVLKYTVCATGKRADMSRSNILQLTFLTYSLKNCQLCKPQPLLPSAALFEPPSPLFWIRKWKHTCIYMRNFTAH
jgi:hypothetical protein